MNSKSLEKQIELLTILVNGCKKHPAYRALRSATGKCDPCLKMWQDRDLYLTHPKFEGYEIVI